MFIAIAKIFMRFAGMRPSPRTPIRGPGFLDSRLRGNDGESGRHGRPSEFCISDSQMDIIFGKGCNHIVLLTRDHGGHYRENGICPHPVEKILRTDVPKSLRMKN
jgi:hypothetical protein